MQLRNWLEISKLNNFSSVDVMLVSAFGIDT